MKEIVNRLHENRQIQLAKEILESNGYKVEKKVVEGYLKESIYKEPVRFYVKEKSGRRIDDLEIAEISKKLVLALDIVVDESDGTYQLHAPGKKDWIILMNKITGLEFEEIE